MITPPSFRSAWRTARFAALVVVPSLVACEETQGPSSPAAASEADAGTDARPPERPSAADPTAWRPAGKLAVARFNHAAIRLPDGRVLVTGGEQERDRTMLRSMEIFDPEAETWSSAGELPEARSNHASVLLANGTVLIIGGGKSTSTGQPLGGSVLGSCLLYDPSTNTVRSTGGLREPRSHFHAARLASGHVLVVGGGSDRQVMAADCANAQYCGPFAGALASAEVYDPEKGEWSAAAPMTTARFSFSLTALPSGKLLAVGGVDVLDGGFKSTELYDPTSNRWSSGPALPDVPREHHTAAALGTGRVLVAGGKNPNVTPLTTVQVFDAEAARWQPTRSMSGPRTSPGLLTLESGHVLVAGGYDQLAASKGRDTFVAEATLYDDESRTWTTIKPLSTGRFGHSMTLLADGRVLVAGGYGESGDLRDVEIGESAP